MKKSTATAIDRRSVLRMGAGLGLGSALGPWVAAGERTEGELQRFSTKHRSEEEFEDPVLAAPDWLRREIRLASNRALHFEARGLRERTVLRERAEGVPFDNGVFWRLRIGCATQWPTRWWYAPSIIPIINTPRNGRTQRAAPRIRASPKNWDTCRVWASPS